MNPDTGEITAGREFKELIEKLPKQQDPFITIREAAAKGVPQKKSQPDSSKRRVTWTVGTPITNLDELNIANATLRRLFKAEKHLAGDELRRNQKMQQGVREAIEKRVIKP